MEMFVVPFLLFSFSVCFGTGFVLGAVWAHKNPESYANLRAAIRRQKKP